MPINFPSFPQIIERSRQQVRDILTGSDPSIKASFVKAIVDSNATRSFDLVKLIRKLLDQAFPQTAEDEYAERWAGYNNLGLLAAQPALGNVLLQGTISSVVPIGTNFTSAAGNLYETQAEVTFSTISQSILSATADAQKLVVCTTTDPHSLASGASADITNLSSGASTSGAIITVISDTSFSFTAPNVTAIGDVLGVGAQYAFIGALVDMESVDAGADKNLGSGSILSLVTPISGVSSEGFTRFDGIAGGTDIETTDSLIARTLERRANPVANFNTGAIIQQVRTVPSVGRVFVLRITPYTGAVTVLFFVTDTASGLPNASQISAVRTAILDNIYPAHSNENDLFVEAPTVVPITHQIDNLVPNDSTLRTAIELNLQAYYADEVEPGQTITVKALENVIQNSQDLSTGNFPQSFDLTSPATSTTIDTTEIASFGSLTFI